VAPLKFFGQIKVENDFSQFPEFFVPLPGATEVRINPGIHRALFHAVLPSFRHLGHLFGRSFGNKSSNDVAFPHPKSGKDNERNGDKSNHGSVVWNLFKWTIDISDYRNGEDEVNPAKN
jgi:hypothetical protein